MILQLNGENIFISTGGKQFDKNKECLIFIHGAAMDHTVWSQQSRFFAHKGYSVISLDLKGHGKSKGKPYEEVKEIAEWVKKLIDHLQIKKPVIIGHSLGALVSIEIAKEIPELITGLILIGFCLPMQVSDDLLLNAKNNHKDAFRFITNWGHSDYSHLGQNVIPGVWLTGNAMKLLESSPKNVLYSDLKAVKNYKENESKLENIVCPTLIICGSEDKMTPPRNLDLIEERIKDIKKVIISKCGHMSMLEEPDIVRSEIVTFLNER